LSGSAATAGRAAQVWLDAGKPCQYKTISSRQQVHSINP
jgi:hypothetical protein